MFFAVLREGIRGRVLNCGIIPLPAGLRILATVSLFHLPTFDFPLGSPTPAPIALISSSSHSNNPSRFSNSFVVRPRCRDEDSIGEQANRGKGKSAAGRRVGAWERRSVEAWKRSGKTGAGDVARMHRRPTPGFALFSPFFVSFGYRFFRSRISRWP